MDAQNAQHTVPSYCIVCRDVVAHREGRDPGVVTCTQCGHQDQVMAPA